MGKREMYVMVLYDGALKQKSSLKEIGAGLEEEGVPYRMQPMDEEGPPHAAGLGAIAADMSPLQVGIGVDRNGVLALHHEKLKNHGPYLQDDWQNGRDLGKNAGRLVKGLPLYLA